MRKWMVTAIAVMGMSLGFTTAVAKDDPKPTKAQPKVGPTDAELDEAHKLNKEYDAKKAKETNTPQPKVGPTAAELDEAHKLNKEYDAKKAAEKKAAHGGTTTPSK